MLQNAILGSMDSITLTRHQSRTIDSVAIDQYGIPGMVLMENAGRGVVDVLLDCDPSLADEQGGTVSILCGNGNNAGDGFVIARHLETKGVRAHVMLLRDPAEFRGDALLNYRILEHTNVRIVDLYSPVSDSSEEEQPVEASESFSTSLFQRLDDKCENSAWLVDAMLGTGAKGEPREPYRTAIEWMNRQDARRMAIDVPSGLDCNSGEVAEVCVRADHTCTFVAVKQGFVEPAAQVCLGRTHVVSIGIPPRLILEVASGQ